MTEAEDLLWVNANEQERWELDLQVACFGGPADGFVCRRPSSGEIRCADGTHYRIARYAILAPEDRRCSRGTAPCESPATCQGPDQCLMRAFGQDHLAIRHAALHVSFPPERLTDMLHAATAVFRVLRWAG